MQSASLAQIHMCHFGTFSRFFLVFSKNEGITK